VNEEDKYNWDGSIFLNLNSKIHGSYNLFLFLFSYLLILFLFTTTISLEPLGVEKKNSPFVYAVTTPTTRSGPYLTLSGFNYTDIASNPSLQLSKFTVSAWFRVNNNLSLPEDAESNMVIVTKTGLGKDTPGNNLNYGIWLTPSSRLRAGFENINGSDFYTQSTQMYNDSKWHFVAIAYDGTALRLNIDGVQMRESILPRDGSIPDNTGTRPLRIGANAYSDKDFFVGNIDEVRIWNRALPIGEIANGYKTGTFNTTSQVLYLPFG
jgi:Concanavalin A-like lectin/glucanases superfamily